MNKKNLHKIGSTFLLSFLLFFSGCGTTDATGNKLPVADAGADITIEQYKLITFDASGSYDPDGTIVSYEWICIHSDASFSKEKITQMPAGLAPDVYEIKLIVTDDKNATAEDSVFMTILPPRFLADAGADFNVTEDGLFTLDANKSFYLDGNITNYKWFYTDDNETIYNGSEEKTPEIQVDDRAVDRYKIKLIVTNDKNETAEDDVFITIGNAPFTDQYSIGIDVDEFKELQAQGAVYIDIRPSGNIIEGSVIIPSPDGVGIWVVEGTDFSNLVTDEDQSFTIICSTGISAAGVANALKDTYGYIHAHYLKGGIGAWNSADTVPR